MSSVAAIILSLLLSLQQVVGDYVVSVQLDSYSPENVYMRFGEGFTRCCDGSCRNLRCDYRFVSCIIPSNAQSCDTPVYTSEVNRQSSNIDFTSDMVLGLPNPLQFPIATPTLDGIRLNISVQETDGVLDVDVEGIIDTFIVQIEPETSGVQQQLQGQNSRIELTVQVMCLNGTPGCGDPCADVDCNSNGECVDGVCVCTAGYTGQTCDSVVDPCDPNPCMNDGTCTAEGTEFSCSCGQPYTGLMCEVDPCESNPCVRGICASNGSCICTPPYSGQTCEISPCHSNPCMGKGVCAIIGAGFRCICTPPYSGQTCEIDPCHSNPCMGRGECTVTGHGFSCSCTQPYSGLTCEECIDGYKLLDDMCAMDLCQEAVCGNGTCTNNGADAYRCVCNQWFTGENCETLACPCENEGTCKYHEGVITCTCPEETRGEFCETKTSCFNVDCGSGRCVNQNETFTCDCDVGHTGQSCEFEIDQCKDNSCNNRGLCVNSVESYQCVCNAGFTGDDCEAAASISEDALIEWIGIGVGALVGVILFVIVGLVATIIVIKYCCKRSSKNRGSDAVLDKENIMTPCENPMYMLKTPQRRINCGSELYADISPSRPDEEERLFINPFYGKQLQDSKPTQTTAEPPDYDELPYYDDLAPQAANYELPAITLKPSEYEVPSSLQLSPYEVPSTSPAQPANYEVPVSSPSAKSCNPLLESTSIIYDEPAPVRAKFRPK